MSSQAFRNGRDAGKDGPPEKLSNRRSAAALARNAGGEAELEKRRHQGDGIRVASSGRSTGGR
jgi:hypothetical protein